MWKDARVETGVAIHQLSHLLSRSPLFEREVVCGVTPRMTLLRPVRILYLDIRLFNNTTVDWIVRSSHGSRVLFAQIEIDAREREELCESPHGHWQSCFDTVSQTVHF